MGGIKIPISHSPLCPESPAAVCCWPNSTGSGLGSCRLGFYPPASWDPQLRAAGVDPTVKGNEVHEVHYEPKNTHLQPRSTGSEIPLPSQSPLNLRHFQFILPSLYPCMHPSVQLLFTENLLCVNTVPNKTQSLPLLTQFLHPSMMAVLKVLCENRCI